MTKDELSNAYFEWMYQLVCDNKRYSKKLSYRKLLRRLHETEFYYVLPMDGNRAEDGVNLRYRFGCENLYDSRMIAIFLDDCPCSVLEMMIALALRCEDHIMDDPDYGNRTGQWFWTMVVNLNLGPMNDSNYDEQYVDETLDVFLNREYGPDGDGSLFKIDNSDRDLRTIEIWYQMHQYLDEVLHV